MKDLNLYAKELVDVVNYLMKKNQLVFSRNNKFIYVNTETIKSMLEKRNYDTVDGKLDLCQYSRQKKSKFLSHISC
ncbi:hypothetical protein P5F28_14230 [Clostridium perfringens]|nr:hypothetical protein [Clostridium perfringens]